jgi:hypothetical protein
VLVAQPTSFVIWGGNTPGLRLGERVQFWGAHGALYAYADGGPINHLDPYGLYVLVNFPDPDAKAINEAMVKLHNIS